MDKYPKFKLSQTATKDLERDETCPTRWKGLWLDKSIDFPSNENMDKGSYFEFLCLGGGATDQLVTDLPRTSYGKKTSDQLRIEDQAKQFGRYFDPSDSDFQGFEIIDTQVKIEDKHSAGTIDFVTKEIATGDIWINDLKLTNDVTNTRTKYGYGNPWDKMDMLQLIHYRELYTNEFGIRPRTALWVFDYTPAKRIKIGEIVISNSAVNIRNTRMEAILDVIQEYDEHGWAVLPSEDECRNCPLICAKRFKSSNLEKFVVNI